MPELLSTALPAQAAPAPQTNAQADLTTKPATKPLRWWITLIVVIATLLEGLVCNHIYFRYVWGDYQSLTVPLPYHEQLGEPAYVFSPQQKSLVVSGLDVDMMTLGFKLKGEHSLISGTVSMTDDASIINHRPANMFKVAPADISVHGNDFALTPAEPVKLLVRSVGKAHSVVISLDNVQSVVVLTDLTLNIKPTYSFSLLRWSALVFIGLAFLGLVRQRWYQVRLGYLSRKGFRTVQGLSLTLCLTLSLGYGYLMAPSHMSPNLTYDYREHGFNFLGNPEYSLLLDFPRTPQEVEYHDPYVQNLDAWLKGQLNIDVVIDADLLKAQDNELLFDMGWREQQGIEGFWDRSFYNGKFYAYYGYGPMLVFYLPLYLITGCAPSPTLSVTFFTLVAILGIYLGTFALARFYGILPQANALVWGLGQAAAVLGTHVLLMQSMLRFYCYAPLLAAGLLGIITYLSYTLLSITSPRKKRWVLAAIGLVIVLMVHTRPLVLLLALALCCPVFCCMVTAKSWHHVGTVRADSASSNYSRKDKLLDALCVGVPVALGAIITMVLNYLRFDSVWEFGQRLCVGLDNFKIKGVDVNLEYLGATIQMFITRPWSEQADFPFYGVLRGWTNHTGYYTYGELCVGLLASPVWWGLALIVLLFMTRHNTPQRTLKDEPQPQSRASCLVAHDSYGINQGLLLKATLIALMLLSIVVWYLDLISTAYSARYTMENVAALVAFVVLLWVKFVDYEETAALPAKICYWATIGIFVTTIVMESLAPFSLIEQEMPYLVPDEWVSAQTFFSPLSTVH